MKRLIVLAAMLLPVMTLMTGCGGGTKNLSDRDILSLIYQKAGGDSWEDKDKENWNSEEDLGKWKNVKVNEEGRVTELSIRGSGEIPADRVEEPLHQPEEQGCSGNRGYSSHYRQPDQS